MHCLSVSSLLFASTALVQAVTLEYTLNIAASPVNLDGDKSTRSAVTVNGRTPGPAIIGNKSDDFLIHTYNNLNDHSMHLSTTIHWHGIFQPRTAYDDGPAWVTQCPIAPNQYYPYHVETKDQAGTFWYHSHLGSQYIDGLRGPLIIYDPEDPYLDMYDVDDENTIITLTDWYHQSAKELAEDWIDGKIPEPIPDSNLLNGRGRFNGGDPVPRSVINVVQGRRYRFRLINMSAIVPFNFAIEGHILTIIEVDGVNHMPYNVTSLGISAGQRYSVIVNAYQPVANYWITYPSNFRVTSTPEVNPNYNGTEAFAVFRYEEAPDAEPTTPQYAPPTEGAFEEYKLVPREIVPEPIDEPLKYNLFFRPGAPSNYTTPGGGNQWFVNDTQYKPPDVPTLLQILTEQQQTNQSSGLDESVYPLPPNRTIDVSIIGGVNGAHHPMHLHGHVFQVIQSATGPRNVNNPPIRDTVDTNGGADPSTAVTIRFRTDNPGPWFLHCHKDWHLDAGFAVVFAEAPEMMRQGPESIHPSPEWEQLCKTYNDLPPDERA